MSKGGGEPLPSDITMLKSNCRGGVDPRARDSHARTASHDSGADGGDDLFEAVLELLPEGGVKRRDPLSVELSLKTHLTLRKAVPQLARTHPPEAHDELAALEPKTDVVSKSPVLEHRPDAIDELVGGSTLELKGFHGVDSNASRAQKKRPRDHNGLAASDVEPARRADSGGPNITSLAPYRWLTPSPTPPAQAPRGCRSRT